MTTKELKKKLDIWKARYAVEDKRESSVFMLSIGEASNILAELTRWAEVRELMQKVGYSIRRRDSEADCQSELVKQCVALSMETD